MASFVVTVRQPLGVLCIAVAAASAYAVLFDAKTGFARKGAFDADGIAQVLALRARYGTPNKRLGVSASYCDLSFLEQAMR